MITNNNGIRKAIKKTGSQAELGRRIGVERSQIHQWLINFSKVPPKKCVQLEQILGIPRIEFRPDDWQEIWPEFKG